MNTRSHRKLLVIGLIVALIPALATAARDVALVTAASGKILRLTDKERVPLESFVKLKEGDALQFEDGARLQVVFFESRRQESWQGKGMLEIASAAGVGQGLAEPQVKVLPAILVKQIAKTPTLDSQGRAGVLRLRAIPTPEALAKLDRDYQQLRRESTAADLNPELFLLAGLLEMRQLDRIEQVLAELKSSHPDNMEAKVLVSLYQHSLKNLRESGK